MVSLRNLLTGERFVISLPVLHREDPPPPQQTSASAAGAGAESRAHCEHGH
jgi:hypothetical protein